MPVRKAIERATETKHGGSVRIMLALLLVATMAFTMKLYMVQEILVLLLVLAVSTVTIFVFAVAFILLQEGIRRAVLWAKIGVVRLAGLSPQDQQFQRTTIRTPR
jgi:hypothetical protein